MKWSKALSILYQQPHERKVTDVTPAITDGVFDASRTGGPPEEAEEVLVLLPSRAC
jgi:hypothetical protein